MDQESVIGWRTLCVKNGAYVWEMKKKKKGERVCETAM
jgi:hypothetical protein